MSADLLLGLDLGTSTCKALLLDASGTEVAVAAAPTPFASSESLIEMRVEDLRGTAAGLVSALGAERRRVAAVGIAGMAECGAPLDRSGGVLAPVISWHDPRGEDVVRRLTEAFGDSLGLRTGQRPRAVSSVAKLGWLVANGCGPVERWLGVPELCLWDLTGTQATEHSLASRTGCYDVLEGVYLPDVAEAAGFSAEVFAEVRRAGDPMGRVPAGAASRWGLPEGVPVTLAGHDHLSGAVGAGAGPGDLVNSVGTAETVLGYAGRPPDLGRALELRTPVSVAPGGRGWVVLAGAARAGVVLAAAAPLLGRSIPELDAMAEA
ncbi:MAG TPA: FGGY family carbohydrate kinase, partial [Acidimicrobiia bacterium]|nr:FGGY family carbohydrate kinase [Acidimicrobiia bacterium]